MDVGSDVENQTAVPVVFAAPRSLRVLNVVAVASSLAACTTAAFMSMMRVESWSWALDAGLPTLLVGFAWAALLRWRRRVPGLGVRWGWISSVPLAALNGALAGGLVLASSGPSDALRLFGMGAILGATFGVVFWGPALVAVLLAFGAPIAGAQKLAKLGLSGEERGEMIVGAVSAAFGLVASFVALVAQAASGALGADAAKDSPLGHAMFFVYALGAIGTGAVAALYAAARDARRRRFVARVEASEEPGYRVEPTARGKVLLRVAPVVGYRVADRAEEIFELDASGHATHRALSSPES